MAKKPEMKINDAFLIKWAVRPKLTLRQISYLANGREPEEGIVLPSDDADAESEYHRVSKYYFWLLSRHRTGQYPSLSSDPNALPVEEREFNPGSALRAIKEKEWPVHDVFDTAVNDLWRDDRKVNYIDNTIYRLAGIKLIELYHDISLEQASEALTSLPGALKQLYGISLKSLSADAIKDRLAGLSGKKPGPKAKHVVNVAEVAKNIWI